MKKVLIVILVALAFASCGPTSRIFPGPVKHGGPCPQNQGMIGYSRY